MPNDWSKSECGWKVKGWEIVRELLELVEWIRISIFSLKVSVILKDQSFQRTSSDSWTQKSLDELEWCGLNCNVSSRLKYFRGNPGVSWFSFNFTLNNSALDHSAIAPSFSGDFFVVRRSPLSAFAIPCLCTRWVQSLNTVHELSTLKRKISEENISTEPGFKPGAAG